MPDTFVQTAYVVIQLSLATGAGHTFSPKDLSRAVCFEIGRVDHNRLRNGRLRGQSFHHPGEDGHVAPTLPMVVEGLRRAVFFLRVGPPQAITFDEIIPLKTGLSSTRGLPWIFGKNGRSRAI
jgi:hypothetical protein